MFHWGDIKNRMNKYITLGYYHVNGKLGIEISFNFQICMWFFVEQEANEFDPGCILGSFLHLLAIRHSAEFNNTPHGWR